MDSWQQDWLKAFETIANEMGQMFEEFGREIAVATDTFFDLTEAVTDDLTHEVEQALTQIDQLIAPKLDQLDEQIEQWVDPMLQTILGLEATIDRAVEPVSHTVEPWLNQHTVCIGCRHYHGQEYGGNFLVCAMHPYGITESDSCPDKETVSWSFPSEQNFTDDL